MDFGRLPADELPLVDFALLPDTALTQTTLKNTIKAEKFLAYVGCAKWGIKEWTGLIYPEKTKEINFLNEYIKHFNSIELNAAFYKMPTPDQVIKWREKAEKKQSDFKFCPKFTQSISHVNHLQNAGELTTTYLKSISHFGKYLGPLFLQLSDSFGPENFNVLQTYLEGLPTDLDVFVELRHKNWFSDNIVRKDVFQMFASLSKGAVITDAAGRRDAVHMELPTPHAFIRFVGNGLHPTEYSRIDEWIIRLAQWKDQGLQSVYLFLHQHNEKDTLVLADYVIRKMNEHLKISLQVPQFLEKPLTLF
jgi:uncharacterized protein YecE (DUF72 family)